MSEKKRYMHEVTERKRMALVSEAIAPIKAERDRRKLFHNKA